MKWKLAIASPFFAVSLTILLVDKMPPLQFCIALIVALASGGAIIGILRKAEKEKTQKKSDKSALIGSFILLQRQDGNLSWHDAKTILEFTSVTKNMDYLEDLLLELVRDGIIESAFREQIAFRLKQSDKSIHDAPIKYR